jgi:hypothetical protein
VRIQHTGAQRNCPAFVRLRTEVSRLVRGLPSVLAEPGGPDGPAAEDHSRDRNRNRAARASHE